MTQKNKNILLGVGLVLILFVAYQFGFAKTFALRGELSQLQKQEALYQSAPTQLAALASKEKQLDAILKTNNVEGTSMQNNILKMLNDTATIIGENNAKNTFKVIAFETPHEYHDESTGSITTTYNFTLEGTYQSLIQTIYRLEQKYSYGNVVQVAFHKKKNYRTGKSSLLCNVLLQRIN